MAILELLPQPPEQLINFHNTTRKPKQDGVGTAGSNFNKELRFASLEPGPAFTQNFCSNSYFFGVP
jgi:hypothetical protein